MERVPALKPSREKHQSATITINNQSLNHPWDTKNCIAKVSMLWLAAPFSHQCAAIAHNRSQCVPLKNTCKKVFGRQLLNTISFLVSKINQHIAAAPINNIILCLCPPYVDPEVLIGDP